LPVLIVISPQGDGDYRGRAHGRHIPFPVRVGQISMPDLISIFGQLDSLDFLRSVLIEQTQFDFRGIG
jgi:hypothetical protein